MPAKDPVLRTAEDIEAAAEIIDERGWCRKTLEDEHGHLCLLGGINEATLGGDERSRRARARHAVAKQLKVEGRMPATDDSNPSQTIWGWNDIRAIDRRQVVAVLRRTAKRLRASAL